MSQSLIIVESPSKAKTIKKYVGKDFDVKASVGHIRDLPKTKLGVDIEKGFEPKYVTIKGKEKVIEGLRKAAKKADQIYLAPDPDREGEAIAWHIANIIAAKDKPIYRVLFNEITKRGVNEGLSKPREIDDNLFASQQARRILDRLVGYKISPLLWVKVKKGLSAGRVQSVAMRLVVDRENEIQAFIPDEYWEIFADLKAEQPPEFRLRLAKYQGKKAKIENAEQANEATEALKNGEIKVNKITKKSISKKAPPPFVTSTLQQTASNQLRMAPKRTMRIAQALYEGIKLGGDGPEGLITYMRTDSFRVANEAIQACREFVTQSFGEQYLPEKPNFYRSRKGSQDAHEAIRPTSMEHHPDKIQKYLTKEQYKVYKLIWNRFVASQMAPAKYDQTTVEAACGDYLLTGASSILVFSGFKEVFINGDDKDDAGDFDKLPPLKEGMALSLVKLDPQQKFTQPPSRFTEAGLIRELEERGVGRPSTYASIISVIQDKEYVEKVKNSLRPTDLGRSVTRLLVKSFPQILDASFTAQMEDDLDQIEGGKNDPINLLQVFWDRFSQELEVAADEMENIKKVGEKTDIICDEKDCNEPMAIKYGRNGAFLACPNGHTTNFKRDEDGKVIVVKDEITDEKCEKCGSAMLRKQGRWGPYLACSGYPDCKNTISLDKNGNKKVKVKAEPDPNVLCDNCQSPMILRTSRYGNRFHACSKYPKCKGIKPYETDIPCPVDGCDGKLVERLTLKGKKRPFWGCSKYPDCDFTTFNEPVQMKCPNCDYPLMTRLSGNKAGTLQCPSCEHEIQEEKAE